MVSPRSPRPPSAAIDCCGNAASASTRAACGPMVSAATAAASATTCCCSWFNRYTIIPPLRREHQFGGQYQGRPQGADKRQPIEHVCEQGASGRRVRGRDEDLDVNTHDLRRPFLADDLEVREP